MRSVHAGFGIQRNLEDKVLFNERTPRQKHVVAGTVRDGHIRVLIPPRRALTKRRVSAQTAPVKSNWDAALGKRACSGVQSGSLCSKVLQTGGPMPAEDSESVDVFELGDTQPTGGVGLCLSGGGYRAMLFHLGALRRLNEAGKLATLTRVSSVSGGSITAGVLGMHWKALEFRSDGVNRVVAHRFSELDGPIVYLVYRFEPKR